MLREFVIVVHEATAKLEKPAYRDSNTYAIFLVTYVICW